MQKTAKTGAPRLPPHTPPPAHPNKRSESEDQNLFVGTMSHVHLRQHRMQQTQNLKQQLGSPVCASSAFLVRYSNTTRTVCTIATRSAPNAIEPMWYLKSRPTDFITTCNPPRNRTAETPPTEQAGKAM